MSIKDNFDYTIPTLNRKDLMSFSTINSNEAQIRPFKKMVTNRDWSINLYNLDIESSCPKRVSVFTNKVDFINKVDDIERTNSKILHYKLDKPEYNLSNADIEKSKPNLGNLHTNRCTNPLEPKYKLPHVDKYPPEQPRFLRDTMNIQDIAGARPNKYFKWKTRETFPLDNHGIEGSKPKPRYVRNTKYNNIDYSDLTRDNFRTRRHTSPLDPVYEVKYKNGEHYTHGVVDGSKPQTVYPYTYTEPFALRVNDIQGAQAGTKNKINQFNGLNYAMTTDDIKGANAGSLKKGISTTRCLNPLIPKYQMPGCVELKGTFNDPFARNVIPKKATPNNNQKQQRKSESARVDHRTPLNKEPEPCKTETNIHNEVNINNNNNIPEGFEQGFNDQLYKVDTVNFNQENYQKPVPFYGFIHDKYVSSTDNPDLRVKIDKKKEEALKSKTSTGFYNSNNRAISATVSSYNDRTAKTFKGGVTAGTTTTNSFGKPSRMLSAGGNAIIPNNTTANINSNTNIMNKTISRNGFNSKMTYAQRLDQFMESNNLKYIGETTTKAKTVSFAPVPEKIPKERGS